MIEKRKSVRLQKDADEISTVICGGVKEDVKLLDVSTGGMRVKFDRPVDLGSDLYGKLSILPDVGPFFVKGKVARVTEREGIWETAVVFEKVSTLPFLMMNMYQVA